MIKNVGFVGLGMMGLPIAKNIIKGGYNLFVGYHSNRGPAEEMEKLGATICETYKEVAQHSDFIITVVPNSAQVEETLFSENGLAKGAKPGTIIADMSTIDLFASRSFAERLAKQGVEFMDAPISGGPEGAAAATLAIMIGGKKEAFEETKPVFDIIGKTIIYCGDNGLGLAAKLANNLIVGAQIVAISEAVCMAVKAGVDPSQLYDVLKGATANSFTLNGKFPIFLKDDYSPSFKLKLMTKDLGIVTDVARKLGSPLMMGAVVEQMFDVCNNEQYADLDCAAVAKFYQEHAGVTFKAKD